MPIPDADTCYRAVASRDARFDGWFFTAVTSTGIYCRPSCPALTPRRANVKFFPSAAGAQRNGFRACKRCRPDASPGSPDWDLRADLTGRALRLIDDGVVDRDGVPGLARRLGYSERQLNRTLLAEVGAGPLALARARRAQTARILLETTSLPTSDVAFAAGFSSVRQFNDTVREVFASTPSALRVCAGGACGPVGEIELRLPYRAPMDPERTLRWLGLHAVAGVETYVEATGAGPAGASVFTRTLRLPHAPGRVALSAGGPGWISARLRLDDQRDLTAAVARVRRLLDLDADPEAIDDALRSDAELAPLIEARSGLRSPGAVDGPETAIRTVIGQQVSLAGARATGARMVVALGERVFDDEPGWLFPSSGQLAAADPTLLPMPRARGRAVVALASALAAGDLVLDPGADRAVTRTAMLAVTGVGPWTADYVLMRALGDPDILLASDLAVRRVAARIGLELPVDATAAATRWSPWRSYVSHHLWAIALDEMADRTRPAGA